MICDSLNGELICVRLNEFQKRAKTNDSGYQSLLDNADVKNSKIGKLQDLTRELEKERAIQSKQKLKQQMESKMSILVNRTELDFRETLSEIVKKYPYVR